MPPLINVTDVNAIRAGRPILIAIAALNVFRHPANDHERLARADLERLEKVGVDGYQIDSVYEHFFHANRTGGHD